VRDERDVQAFVEGTVQKYGQLNVAFNNAGITIEKPLTNTVPPSGMT